MSAWTCDLRASTPGNFISARIRPEMKFAGVEALKAQVQADMTEARRLLRGAGA